jgi:hypothetical protein
MELAPCASSMIDYTGAAARSETRVGARCPVPPEILRFAENEKLHQA